MIVHPYAGCIGSVMLQKCNNLFGCNSVLLVPIKPQYFPPGDRHVSTCISDYTFADLILNL